MAALVTLTVAKNHLRMDVADTFGDADLTLKIAQASDIVQTYLKGRTIPVSTLTSVGGVATMTTAVPHALATNDTVTIRGAEQPEYNGPVSVTVTSTTTFTYAVTGTPAGTATGGLAIRAAQPWTDSNVPAQVQAAVLTLLAQLVASRGDGEVPDDSQWQRYLTMLRDPAYA